MVKFYNIEAAIRGTRTKLMIDFGKNNLPVPKKYDC